MCAELQGSVPRAAPRSAAPSDGLQAGRPGLWTSPPCLAVGGDSTLLPLPSQARVVICGGGIVGSSVAFHLAKLGWTDIVLLEQGSVAKPISIECQMANYSNGLYKGLEEETGVKTGYVKTGSLCLAQNQDRFLSLKRLASRLKVMGISCNVIKPKEVAKLHPHVNIHDLVGALHLPGDAVVSPPDINHALAVLVENGQVTAVETDRGSIECEFFVNCAGQWAYELGQASEMKVSIPLHGCEQFYLLTKPLQDPLPPDTPGGVLSGGFEKNPKPIFTEGRNQLEIQNMQEDWDHFEPMLSALLRRMPSLESAEIHQLVNCPESFTPDMRCLMGETPGISGYFVLAGMNSSGLAFAGGAGNPAVRAEGSSLGLPDGPSAADESSPDWFDIVGSEVKCCKEAVCVIDMSSFTKFELTGGYENDCSVVRVSKNSFFIVSPTDQQVHCWAWIKKHMPNDPHLHLEDVSWKYTALNLIGPRAMDVLAELSYVSMTPDHFPSMFCKEMSVGYANGIRVMSMTHTGEPGFMLYVPIEYALHVYNELMSVGQKYGIRNAGYYALRSLRIEKFFAFWGQDLDAFTTPLECGREFRVKFDTDTDFLGRAGVAAAASGRCVQALRDAGSGGPRHGAGPVALPVYRNDQLAGTTTSSAYSYTLERHICLGFVSPPPSPEGLPTPITPDFINRGDYEVDIAGQRYPPKPNSTPSARSSPSRNAARRTWSSATCR
ncbi:hypothetical protein F7725_025923, partial [Dissostichus mawsoni]